MSRTSKSSAPRRFSEPAQSRDHGDRRISVISHLSSSESLPSQIDPDIHFPIDYYPTTLGLSWKILERKWKLLLLLLLIPSTTSLFFGICLKQDWELIVDIVPFNNNLLNTSLLIGAGVIYPGLCLVCFLLADIYRYCSNSEGGEIEEIEETKDAIHSFTESSPHLQTAAKSISWKNLNKETKTLLLILLAISCISMTHGISLKYQWQVIEDITPFDNNPLNSALLVGASAAYMFFFILILLPEGTLSFCKQSSDSHHNLGYSRHPSVSIFHDAKAAAKSPNPPLISYQGFKNLSSQHPS